MGFSTRYLKYSYDNKINKFGSMILLSNENPYCRKVKHYIAELSNFIRILDDKVESTKNKKKKNKLNSMKDNITYLYGFFNKENNMLYGI